MDIDELFVPIEGYPNYEVSNYGRVVNVKRDTDLKATLDGSGYLKVRLSRENVKRTINVHRLVAQAFFVDFTEDVEVRFINHNRSDCSVRNLHLIPRKVQD